MPASVAAATDDLHPRRGGDVLGLDLGLRAHDQGVIVTDPRQQLLRLLPGDHVDIEVPAQVGDTVVGDGIGDQDPRPGLCPQVSQELAYAVGTVAGWWPSAST